MVRGEQLLSPSMEQTRFLIPGRRDVEGGSVSTPPDLKRLSAEKFQSEHRPLLLRLIVATRMRGERTLFTLPGFFCFVLVFVIFY